MRELYRDAIMILNGSAYIAILVYLSELSTTPWFFRILPVGISFLGVLYFYIKSRQTLEHEPPYLRRVLIPGIIILFLLTASFWPLYLKQIADEMARWYYAGPLEYSYLSWAHRQTDKPFEREESSDTECVKMVKAKGISPHLILTSEFKLSAAIEGKYSRYKVGVKIGSKYEEEWVLQDVIVKPSTIEIDKKTGEQKILISERPRKGEFQIQSLPSGEHVRFICCWKYVGSIRRQTIDCRDAVNISFTDSRGL